MLIYVLGRRSPAPRRPRSAWVLSGLRSCSSGRWSSALYGLCAGSLFRTEAAVSAASGLLVILAFLGNIFIPLSGTMLAIGRSSRRSTGTSRWVRYPLTEGDVLDGDGWSTSRCGCPR